MAGGEPLLHRDLAKIVEGVIARKKFAIVCTNALLLEKKIDQYKPSPYFTWSIHLDGDQEMHDKSVCEPGVYDRAVKALKTAKAKGFRVTINCTFFNDADPERVAAFFDTVTELGVDGITVSPGYAYERAPDQKHFLNRSATKQLFRSIFERGDQGRKWAFNQSTMFLDFLAGNQTYHCTPWGNPTRTVFGWQKPCYLLGEGYAKTFKELMDDTDWDAYGTGNYEKCADCMVHSGFEATAVRDTVTKPWKAARVALMGVKTDGPDGAGHPAREPARGPVRVRQERRPEAVRHPPLRGRGKGPEEGPGSALAPGTRRGCRARAARSPANCPGERISSPMTATSIDPAIGIHGFQHERRQVAFGGVGDRAQNRERDPLFERILAGDQAFHVDRGRFRGAAQIRLGGGGQDRSVGGRQTFDNDARSGAGEALRKRRCNGLVGSDGALIRDDFRAENEVAGTEPRIKPAAQPPTDHERRPEARRFRQPGAQGWRVATERRASRSRRGSPPRASVRRRSERLRTTARRRVRLGRSRLASEQALGPLAQCLDQGVRAAAAGEDRGEFVAAGRQIADRAIEIDVDHAAAANEIVDLHRPAAGLEQLGLDDFAAARGRGSSADRRQSFRPNSRSPDGRIRRRGSGRRPREPQPAGRLRTCSRRDPRPVSPWSRCRRRI